MLGRNALVVASREYFSRVKTKGFWISTLVLPLIMIAMIVLPAFFLSRTNISHHLVIVDETGRIGQALRDRLAEGKGMGSGEAQFHVKLESAEEDVARHKESLNARIVEGEIDAWLWISKGVLKNERVAYHAGSVSNFLTQEILRDKLTDIVRRARFEDAGYNPDAIGNLLAKVHLDTVRVSEEGEKKEGAAAGFILAYVLGLLLYMLLVLYGQQVLNGVLEEKTSRVVEVIVSTLSPFDLMMGKLIGIGLVGLTQVSIWLCTALVITAPALLTTFLTLPDEIDLPTITPWQMFNFGVFFLLGYFIYCTFYAAIGSAFNNLQEATQYSMIGVAFLIVPLMLMPVIINDPDSSMSSIMSFIPPFTPILMMLRVAVKPPPVWQVLLSYVTTGAFGVFMVWFCSRIYRVGILMYGKKPTIPEIVRWVRH